jgi:hypothetical protein
MTEHACPACGGESMCLDALNGPGGWLVKWKCLDCEHEWETQEHDERYDDNYCATHNCPGDV